MLHFDNRGYLTPYKAIPSTVKEMKEYFVDSIQSKTRKEIFVRYLKYSEDLKDAVGGISLKQWVNGSFVTMKTNPKDIDLVTFIDFGLIKKLGNKLDPFRKGTSWENYKVDAYLQEIHPSNSPMHKLTEFDIKDWLNVFLNNRNEKSGALTQKGFLEIIY